MSPIQYFSDRERGTRARTEEAVSITVWGALHDLIQARIEDGSFGLNFPEACQDGRGTYGTDSAAFWRAARAEIPGLPESLRVSELPDLLLILDLLEFCARSVAQPQQRDYHSFFGHHHLNFDQTAGRQAFAAAVERLFARNGIAFELTLDGTVQRLGPTVLRDELRTALFHTGDSESDKLLEDARRRFLSPTLSDRQDSIEKLWDAFERIKTLEPGPNKRETMTRLLDRTASNGEPKFREYIETEARALTEIGNTLRIRHSETDKEPLQSATKIDYLFHRMFSFLLLLMRATGRAT